MPLPAPSTNLRLLPQHLAHLRAVAEGVTLADSARRYLGVQHGAEAPGAHRAAVEVASAVARRNRDSRWRLLPLALSIAEPAAPSLAAPSVEEWAEAEGLMDWSADELEALYVERFPPQKGDARKRARNERLRLARLALLRQLEAATAEPAKPTDQISGWFDTALADRLLRIGFATLGDLQRRISQGGRWWAGMQGFGVGKAARVERQVLMLLGPLAAPAWASAAVGPELDGRNGANRAAPVPGALDAHDDRTAVRRWIEARAGSAQTVRSYEREADRFMLWMLARGRALSDAGPQDCSDYKRFLADVPADWVSRRNARRLQPGWAPFSGPLSATSQRQAITILASLFAWLAAARYLASDPWVLVNRRVADDRTMRPQVLEVSRAFTPAAWDALTAHLPSLDDAAAARMRWLIFFLRATGLRSAEVLEARRGHLVYDGSWWLNVMGKGSKQRVVPVPSGVMDETRTYFIARGLSFDTASDETVLLGALTTADEPRRVPLHYSSLYGAFTRFVRSAIRASSLSDEDRRRAALASAHWLRHTHATRAAEAGVQPDVLQANLGQADPRTTAVYYKAQAQRRRDEIERVYGSLG